MVAISFLIYNLNPFNGPKYKASRHKNSSKKPYILLFFGFSECSPCWPRTLWSSCWPQICGAPPEYYRCAPPCRAKKLFYRWKLIFILRIMNISFSVGGMTVFITQNHLTETYCRYVWMALLSSQSFCHCDFYRFFCWITVILVLSNKCEKDVNVYILGFLGTFRNLVVFLRWMEVCKLG